MLIEQFSTGSWQASNTKNFGGKLSTEEAFVFRSQPSNVLIYHGTHTENPSYTTGSPTEMPIPKEAAHTFPIIYDSGNLPIIFNNQNGLVEPYTSTSVQNLFTTQACIPMTATYEAN